MIKFSFLLYRHIILEESVLGRTDVAYKAEVFYDLVLPSFREVYEQEVPEVRVRNRL